MSSSPMDRHWNRQKRKAQELDDVCRGIDILDAIVIGDNDFVDEDPNSTSMFELAKQVRPFFFLFFIFFEYDHIFISYNNFFSWTFKNYVVKEKS